MNHHHHHLVRIIPRLALTAIAAIALFAVASLAAPPDAADAQDVIVIRYANAAPPAPSAVSLSIGISWTPGPETGSVFCMPSCVQHVDTGLATSYVLQSRKLATYDTDGTLIPGTSWAELAVVRGNPPATSWSGTTQIGYEYRVKACNNRGCSAWSPTAALSGGIS